MQLPRNSFIWDGRSKCPACDRALRLLESSRGTSTWCPGCKTPLHVSEDLSELRELILESPATSTTETPSLPTHPTPAKQAEDGPPLNGQPASPLGRARSGRKLIAGGLVVVLGIVAFAMVADSDKQSQRRASAYAKPRSASPPPPAYPSLTSPVDVHVTSHSRENGAAVKEHYRSYPDGDKANNWSTFPNRNPYTGAVGARRLEPNASTTDLSLQDDAVEKSRLALEQAQKNLRDTEQRIAALEAERARMNQRYADDLMNQTRRQAPGLAPAIADVIESKIDDDFEGWDGETIFKLANGQVWQQASYAYTYHYAYRPDVLVIKTTGGHKMTVDGVSGSIAVKLLSGPDLIESRIDGNFNGWKGATVFKLENGQIWQQSAYGYHVGIAIRPKVFILRAVPF